MEFDPAICINFSCRICMSIVSGPLSTTFIPRFIFTLDSGSQDRRQLSKVTVHLTISTRRSSNQNSLVHSSAIAQHATQQESIIDDQYPLSTSRMGSIFELSTFVSSVVPVHFLEVQLLPPRYTALHQHATVISAFIQSMFCTRYQVKIVN